MASEYQHIQVLAFRDFTQKTPEYKARHILRWYSATFHTPLHVAEELDFIEILRHYYEHYYEGLEEVDLAKERINLSLTDDERALRDTQTDEFLDLLRKKAKPTPKVAPAKSIAEGIQGLSKDIKKALEEFKDIEMSFGEDPLQPTKL